MTKSKKQKELDEELLRECEGYHARQDKPDGAYIEEGEYFFNINKIKRLIEAGAKVNAKDKRGNSPLHWAVGRNNVALVKLLISAGADVNSKTKYGRSPLFNVSYVSIAKLLISAGADVNAKNNDGESPLHFVRYVPVVKLLISAGANVNVKGGYTRESPLHRAVDMHNVALVKLLIKAGADVNAKNSSDKTPLYYARTKIIQALLIEHGATK